MTTNNTLIWSRTQTQRITWTILFLMPIIGMVIDLIAPSLPGIMHALQVPPSMVKNIISIYILGYGLGNFFTGILTDALGRKKLLQLGLLGFILVSLLPIFFPNISILLTTRFLQGFTLGAVAVLSRAILSDVLPAQELIRMGTVLGTLWGLGPVLGPVIGGYLQYYIGWQAGFYFFAISATIGLLAVVFIVPETHTTRHPLTFKKIRQSFVETVRHPIFITMTILMGLTYSLMVVFNTLGPFLIQHVLHYSSIFFGHLAMYLGLSFLAGTFCCRFCLKKHSVEKLLSVTTITSFIITVGAVGMSYFLVNNIALITIVSALMFFTCGFVFPMSMGKSMSLFRHIAGTAAATMYLLNMSITSLSAFVVSFVSVHSAITLMWVYFILLSLCILVYWVGVGLRPSHLRDTAN